MTGDAPQTRRGLVVARVLWIVLAMSYAAIWLASLAGFYARVSTLTILPFRLAERVIFDNAIAAQEATQRGMTIETSALFTIGLSLIQIVAFYAIAAVILWRATNGFGLFTAFVLLLFSVNNMELPVGVAPPFPGALLWIEAPTYIVWPLWVLWLALFPNGKVVPSWMRIPFALGMTAFMFLQIASLLAVAGILPPQIDTFAAGSWAGIIVLPVFGFVLISQVYRYLRVSTRPERQQTKWFLFGVGIFFAGIAAYLAFPDLFKTSFLLQNFFSVVFLVFPITVALAILRYRLWDIDILIRRTVTYVIVVGLLLIAYFGSVILLQQMFAGITGQRSEVVTALSTLAIAALFIPVRNRVQNAIDKRFNRQKYDAQKVLRKFSETVRDETDLEKLSAELLNVVNETMQPKSASIWLRKEQNKK